MPLRSDALDLPALRIALAALRLGQPFGPAAALARAARLRLSPAERAEEIRVDALRAGLAASPERLHIVDYGAGSRSRAAAGSERGVAEVYRRAATGRAWGRFLFGLVRGLQPRAVLELGTNLGVSAAHLAGALRLNDADAAARAVASGGPLPEPSRLVTLEGDPGLAARARAGLDGLGHGRRASVEVGPFVETLGPACAARGPFGLVFVDGHHEEAAALAYVGAVLPHLASGALVVLDDVEPGRPVWRAWRRLRQEHAGVYLGKLGVLAPSAPPGARGAHAAPARLRGAASPASEAY